MKVGDDLVRFAAVDDNANTITLWKLVSVNLIPLRSPGDEVK